MKPTLTPSEAAAKIKDGMTIMAAGFLSTGSAISVWQELAKSNVKDLTINLQRHHIPRQRTRIDVRKEAGQKVNNLVSGS